MQECILKQRTKHHQQWIYNRSTQSRIWFQTQAWVTWRKDREVASLRSLELSWDLRWSITRRRTKTKSISSIFLSQLRLRMNAQFRKAKRADFKSSITNMRRFLPKRCNPWGINASYIYKFVPLWVSWISIEMLLYLDKKALHYVISWSKMLSYYVRGKCNRFLDKGNKFLKKRKFLRKTSMVRSISL